ncbi:hypothetical protein EPO04_00475 [Patescibacteria group bacterium]|nr:MAG: hypothetical protein EPO04_00475 [Patescibacteria group bacterium]
MEPFIILIGIFLILTIIGWLIDLFDEYAKRRHEKKKSLLTRELLKTNFISSTSLAELKKEIESMRDEYVNSYEYEEAKIAKSIHRINRSCPECKTGYMVKRDGMYGEFLGCNRYPNCSCTRDKEWVNVTAKKDIKAYYNDLFIEDFEKAYK